MAVRYVLWSGSSTLGPKQIESSLLAGRRPSGIRSFPLSEIERFVSSRWPTAKRHSYEGGLRLVTRSWDLTIDESTLGTIWIQHDADAAAETLALIEQLQATYGLHVLNTKTGHCVAGPPETDEVREQRDRLLHDGRPDTNRFATLS